MEEKKIRLKLRFVADGTSRSRHLASLHFRGPMCKKGGGRQDNGILFSDEKGICYQAVERFS